MIEFYRHTTLGGNWALCAHNLFVVDNVYVQAL